MSDAILTLNAGSSSLKFALFDVADGALRLSVKGEAEKLDSIPHFMAEDTKGKSLTDESWAGASFDAVIGKILDWATSHLGQGQLVAVGHRMVHGGPDHVVPERVTPALLAALDALVPLAPLHLPHNIAPIRAIARARPSLAQVMTYDTAFHRTMPDVATRIAIPRRYEAEGVRRYGFHGLSYEYIAGRLTQIAPALAKGRTIVAHLGNGASLCALLKGKSVDTTMGFSALDGLVMGTRPGDIDPGVLLYLQERDGMSVQALEHMLYNESGLKGVSGLSGDMRTLLESSAQSAKDALALFVFRLAREIGALTASLGGLDGLVFTAGIGEHAPQIRAMTVEKLSWLGAKLDTAANAGNAEIISTGDSKLAVLVIPTNEEEMIARHTLGCIA
ncbi:MAG TPA: acetate/propionate family kinase [Rhizomicrobium sp.]|jgi:acetate kinase|nr:acetate/propionate family kinase [Rhizomicrobium sp.]